MYIYKWGCTILRSLGISTENECHPHVIKDFISSLKKNIRNKIANKWVEMKRKPHTIQEAFRLAGDIEAQIQVADNFKLEWINYFPPVEVNKISTSESSGKEYEVNEVSRGKKWGNNQYSKPHYNNNHNSSARYQPNSRTQGNRSGKKWDHKEKDSKITLTHKSAHFMPPQLSDAFFKRFNLAMKLKKEKTQAEVSKVGEGNLVEIFGITKDQMVRAAEILTKKRPLKTQVNHQPD